MKTLFFACFAVSSALGQFGAAFADQIVEVAPRSEISLQPLNPLRGDLSPKAGVLWGDIKQDLPTGALIEFVDGFSSPPHIHNITYRAVVISGFVHNDDPAAAKLWMGPGSFWTQPAGQNHITAAKPGARATAFLEIDSGPYLVQPAQEAFDNGERPVNLEARNLVWLEATDTSWIEFNGEDAPQPEIAFLWGEPRRGAPNGTFLKLPGGAEGVLRGGDAWLRAVVIGGETEHAVAGLTQTVKLTAGSYFGADQSAAHTLSCAVGADCLFYVRTEGKYRFSPGRRGLE